MKLPHTMKIWEWVIDNHLLKNYNRFLKIVLPKIPDQQFGFVLGKWTAGAIQAMRILIEKIRNSAKDLRIIFVDVETTEGLFFVRTKGNNELFANFIYIN